MLDFPRQISVKDPEAITRHIDEYKKEREQRMAAQRAAKQQEELQQCTFSPAINPDTPRRDDTPVVVRGLGRHLELQARGWPRGGSKLTNTPTPHGCVGRASDLEPLGLRVVYMVWKGGSCLISWDYP